VLPHWFSLVRDELQVLIQPQSIELSRLKGIRGFKPQLIHQKTINLKKDVVNSPDDWQDVVKNLQILLKDGKWYTPNARVILSSYFMRYAVIPWNSEITTDDESQAYLNHHFVMAYGDVVKSWNMCMDVPKYKQSGLASAMPNSLRLALNDVFAQANIRLAAIYPYLMEVVNQLLEANNLISNCWLVVVESQRLSLSLIEEGEWRVVRSLPLETDIAAQIEALIQREAILENVSVKNKNHPILIHWPQAADIKTIDIKHRRVMNVGFSHHSGARSATMQQSMR